MLQLSKHGAVTQQKNSFIFKKTHMQDANNMIFEVFERTNTGPMKYSDTEYSYLNTSSRKESEKVRNFLEKIAQNYPEQEIAEVIARIRSGDDRHFRSASFELILFEILRVLGCTLTPHPELPNGQKKRPDFLVSPPSGEEFYLEAVLASEKSNQDKGAEKRKGIIYDSINNLKHNNFWLDLDAEGDPATPPKGKPLKKQLIAWLDSLNPDKVIEDIRKNGFEAAPTIPWQHDGWEIKFRAMPIEPERRGKGQKLVGMLGGAGGHIDTWSPIRDALIEKGHRYGELDKPLIIAVNSDSFTLDRIDEIQALFGQEQFSVNTNSKDAEPNLSRALNGAWHDKGGPRYTRVSGAWLFNNLTPWTVANRKQTLYCNPYASLEIPEFMHSFPCAKTANGEIIWGGGFCIRCVLDLSESWPR